MSVDDGVQTGPRDEPTDAVRRKPPASHRATAAPSPRKPPASHRATAAPSPRKPWWHWLTEFPGLLVVVLVAAVLIRTFLVAPFYIPSSSMEDTLRIGDRVLVDRVSYRIHPIRRGDVVVFDGLDSFTPEVTTKEPTNPVAKAFRSFASALGIAPPGQRDFIKRVIGVPGDVVSCAGPGKPIMVNGVALDEKSYLFPGDDPSTSRFSVKVPAGRLWVMGDHRSVSADSRSHLGDPGGGTVPADKVIGRAFVVIWPYAHWTGLGTPATYEQKKLQAVPPPAAYALAALVLPTALGAAPVVGRRRREPW